MDIVEMPREDYSDNDKVGEFAKEHSATGIGVELNDISYAYNNG